MSPLLKTRPTIQSIQTDDFFLMVEWDNGHQGKFPFIFLQDNAPGIRHVNGQKLIETATLDITRRPANISLSENKDLCIRWDDGQDEQIFSCTWLWEHDFHNNRHGQSINSHEFATAGKSAAADANGSFDESPDGLWDHALNSQLPEHDFTAICEKPAELHAWLGHVQKYGFAILRNVPPVDGMVLEVVKLFGFVRETNYGQLFDVKTVIRPNNLAFTGLGISAHTDNPYRNPTPSLQLLHCLSSDANGGDSILSDGFSIAEDLRQHYPAYFKVLSTVMVTYQFRDADNWLERSSPIISTWPDGTIASIRLNNRSIQPVRLSPDDLLEFYKAYLQFVKMTNDEKYVVRFKMSPGDLYIVDNERVTHARSAYDNKGGERWLQGAYADRDGLLSKWRVLGHTISGNNKQIPGNNK